MSKIDTFTFLDGISFCKDEYEIAFYSKFSKRINYYKLGIKLAYPDYEVIQDVSIPLEDNIYIIKKIEEYINGGNNNGK